MTLQNEPPTLETSLAGSKKSRFSSKFKEVISTCLKKEPKERCLKASGSDKHLVAQQAHSTADPESCLASLSIGYGF